MGKFKYESYDYSVIGIKKTLKRVSTLGIFLNMANKLDLILFVVYRIVSNNCTIHIAQKHYMFKLKRVLPAE